MTMKYRVFDDRTNETLFESDDNIKCALFIGTRFDDEDDSYEHVWIEENK